MLSALDVSLDICQAGEESFPLHDYTQKPAVLRGSRTHTAVLYDCFALLQHPLKTRWGWYSRDSKEQQQHTCSKPTQTPRNTDDFPRHDDTVERGRFSETKNPRRRRFTTRITGSTRNFRNVADNLLPLRNKLPRTVTQPTTSDDVCGTVQSTEYYGVPRTVPGTF